LDLSYDSSSATGPLNIYPASASWTTNPSSKTYGNPDPTQGQRALWAIWVDLRPV